MHPQNDGTMSDRGSVVGRLHRPFVRAPAIGGQPPHERAIGPRAGAIGQPIAGSIPFFGQIRVLDHTCAVRADASLWCWGDNRGGQLGDGTIRARRTAAPVLGLPAPVRQVSLGHSHSCAVLTDDSLWCWGENDEGQLGDGTRVSRRLPVQVAAPR